MTQTGKKSIKKIGNLADVNDYPYDQVQNSNESPVAQDKLEGSIVAEPEVNPGETQSEKKHPVEKASKKKSSEKNPAEIIIENQQVAESRLSETKTSSGKKISGKKTSGKKTSGKKSSGKKSADKKTSDKKSKSKKLTTIKYEDIHFVDSTKPVWNYSMFSEEDISNFQNGTHYRLYEIFGSHHQKVLETDGYYFAVWAPNATFISVIGNFNDWNTTSHPLFVRLDKSGIWEGFIPNIPKGESYKYHIHGYKDRKMDKGDPYANFWEKRPLTASITWDL
ncbi:MAG TPA: hypothetical protein VK616_16315, partial [Flavitalea sp.]|nr:hypothetical protein [Flavitalea sp.]